MALVQCDTHGLSHCEMVTPAVQKAVLADSPMNPGTLWKVYLVFPGIDDEIWEHWADSVTAAAHDLQPGQRFDADGGNARHVAFFGLTGGVCIECFESWLQRHELTADDGGAPPS